MAGTVEPLFKKRSFLDSSTLVLALRLSLLASRMFLANPLKRALENGAETLPAAKRTKSSESKERVEDMYNKVATFENANRVRQDPPVAKLQQAIRDAKKEPAEDPGKCVVYWMRMQDMRVEDNRAIAAASTYANEHKIPLIVVFLFVPQDYAAHDRGARRIDFMLRNLDILKVTLDKLDIPLYAISHSPRKTLPSKAVELAHSWGAKTLYANLEYEVDEVRRDLQVIEIAKSKGIHCDFHEDKLVVPPFSVATQQGKQFSVYSPWLRAWKVYLDAHPECFAEAPAIVANSPTTRTMGMFSPLFDITIPHAILGYELEDREKMEELWPAGTEAAREILHRFVSQKHRIGQLDKSPLNKGGINVLGKGAMAGKGKGETRIGRYNRDRDMADRDSSSRLSPYLASGVISIRELIRETMRFLGVKKVDASKENGPGVWVTELGWRDFYTHVLAAFPHVSMGRPFQEKYADIKWEVDQAKFEAWRDGKTGYPIVDASMRQLKAHGWMHNRQRMIVAMFLTKDLLMDWRLGEKWFMNQLIDGDLANNNGGWQWSASTGVDPQPYFRVFNPTLQSEKADPSGDLIRHFVPELRGLKGKAIHDPFHVLKEAEFKKLGYPKPIVDHKEARDRAIKRYQNPGEE